MMDGRWEIWNASSRLISAGNSLSAAWNDMRVGLIENRNAVK